MAEGPVHSLRWRLLAFLLLPLLLLVAAQAWFGYDRAVHAANDAYDRSLYLTARTLAEDLKWREGQLQFQMRPGTGYLFENNTGSRLFYQVTESDGRHLLGARDLPRLQGQPQQVHFFALVDFADAQYRGAPVRLVRLAHVLPQPGREDRVVHVSVVETRETRDDLIETILRETLGSQALLLLAVALLVSLAVRLVVQPLHRLRQLIEGKDDDWPLELRFPYIGLAKTFISDNVLHMTRHAMAMVGGSSFRKGAIFERLYRDSAASMFQPLNGDQSRTYIGEYLLQPEELND